jgi:hypothetical protein
MKDGFVFPSEYPREPVLRSTAEILGEDEQFAFDDGPEPPETAATQDEMQRQFEENWECADRAAELDASSWLEDALRHEEEEQAAELRAEEELEELNEIGRRLSKAPKERPTPAKKNKGRGDHKR